MNNRLIATGLLAFVTTFAQAQSAPAAPTGAKKELVQRLLTLQQASLDTVVRNLAEQPARQMMAAAEPVLQNRVPADKREAVSKQIEGDVRKYLDDALPLLRDRAQKAATSEVAPAMAERFSDEELRQLIAFLESPTYKKYQTAMPELSNLLLQKLVADARPLIDPKLKALEQSVAAALGVAPSGGAPAPAGTAPATGASRPAR